MSSSPGPNRRWLRSGLLVLLGFAIVMGIAGIVIVLNPLRLGVFGAGDESGVGAVSPVAEVVTPAPQVPTTPIASPQSSPLPSLVASPVPVATPTPVTPNRVVEEYLRAWQEGRYADMYPLLSDEARRSISAEAFVERYEAITDVATIETLEASLHDGDPRETAAGSAEARIRVEMKTRLVGDILEENVLPLTYENGDWRVQWSPSLIFKDLVGDYLIRMFPETPSRGSIFDRQGRPLAAQGFVVSVGIVPGEMTDEAQVIAVLDPYVKIDPADLRARAGQAQPDWFVPLVDVPAAQEAEVEAKVQTIPGMMVQRKAIRAYPAGDTASHVIGFISRITAEEVDRLATEGYGPDDRIGRAGVEESLERELAGTRGGRLTVITTEGAIVKTIKERRAVPGKDVHLTIDLDVQQKAEQVLGTKPGSIVVMDPRDNTLLALASFPRFDPNKFVLGFTDEEWRQLSEDRRSPFLNRPTEVAYPTGSIFKVITMAAGMERGGFQADSVFDCPGVWYGLGPGNPMRNWRPEGQGRVTLQHGITNSCNPIFYEIGKKLDEIDPQILPDVTRRFGLGQPTGVVGLREASGLVPDPAWKRETTGQPWVPGDSVNLAIGQGYLEATPLQMANVYSALAAKGTLRAPVLVQRIVEPGGQNPQVPESPPDRSLGVSEAYLTAVHAGMVGTTREADGTANYAFRGYGVPTAAKTGSAENPGPNAHAWFAGYAPADDPRAVVIVMIEGGGAGSEVAAPPARQMMEAVLGASPGGG